MEFKIKVRTIFPLRVNEFLIAFKFQCQADMAALNVLQDQALSLTHLIKRKFSFACWLHSYAHFL